MPSADELVTLKDMKGVREAAHQYMVDNAGWRAEDRDLVWGQRYVIAHLSVMGGKQMTFGEVTAAVRAALDATSSEQLKFLTAELMASKLIAD